MSTEKTYIGADSYLHDMWRLAAKVHASGWKPDVMIALWRGGAPVGVAVHEFFAACGWKPRHTAIKCTSYTGIGENAGQVKMEYADEALSSIRPGEKVLVVDDVFDTGKTALAIKKLMDARGIEMRLATVYFKPSKNTTDIEPDYFVKETGGQWIVFPHEICGLSRAEIEEKDGLLAQLLPRR